MTIKIIKKLGTDKPSGPYSGSVSKANVVDFEDAYKTKNGNKSETEFAEFILDGNGKKIDNVANAITFIRHDDALQTAISKDLMANEVLISKPLPNVKKSQKGKFPRPILETDVTAIQAMMNAGGLKRISREATYHAVAFVAAENSFHPLRDELSSLVWDKKKRLNNFLHQYLGTECDEYHSQIGTMVLIGAVARVFEPGCKMDHMMVLEGKQGAGKSTVCAIIGGKWFSDNLPDLGSGKEVSQHLSGRWIVEVPELAATSRAESANLKAFISRPSEKYRRPYARTESDEPRQCILIGTTNKSAYLRDETGARRFWPVKVGKVNLEQLAEDRNQLLAEAVERYRNGEKWYPSQEFEEKHIFPRQFTRYEEDVWEEPVRDYLVTLCSKTAYVGDILTQGLQVEKPKHSRADQNRVTAILERLGWERLKKDGHGNQPWGPAK